MAPAKSVLFITGAAFFGIILVGESAAAFRLTSIALILCGAVGRNIGSWQSVDKVRQRRSRGAQRLDVRQRVRFASLLAAALLDGLSKQTAGHIDSVRDLSRGSLTGVVIEFVSTLLAALTGGECARIDGLSRHSSFNAGQVGLGDGGGGQADRWVHLSRD